MKTRNVLMSLAAALLAGGAFAQTIENDDMYFSAKDRAKLRSSQTSEMMASAKPAKKATLVEENEKNINPTDSYSARNVNPEFAARSNAQVAQADNEDYFINNYQHTTATDLNNWNNNFSSWYGNSWYSPNYYGSSINSWNSPYYGFNDPYMSPWYNPYWSNSGWSTSFSYYWGNSWNYGWGGNYNYWNQPYCGGSSWGPSVGLGLGWSSGWYGPGTTVVVVNNAGEGRHTSYGKRGTRGTNMVSERPRVDTRDRMTSTQMTSNNPPALESGRTSSSTNRSRQEYYNRSWKNTSTQSSQSSGFSQGNNTNSNWDWSNNNTNRSSNSGSSSSGSSYTPSRSSGSSFSGGSRSSGGSSSSGSSSGSRGRTRN